MTSVMALLSFPPKPKHPQVYVNSKIQQPQVDTIRLTGADLKLDGTHLLKSPGPNGVYGTASLLALNEHKLTAPRPLHINGLRLGSPSCPVPGDPAAPGAESGVLTLKCRAGQASRRECGQSAQFQD